jgi:hypothetical protein
MGSSSTGSAVKSTFGGGQSGQSRATGFGNLATTGSVFSDFRSFAENPSAFLRGDDGSGEEDSQPTLDDLDLGQFRSRLNQVTPEFFEADFGAENTRGIAELLERRGRGIAPRDTAFERFRDSQFNIFEQGAEQERANVASNLARRGLGSSSTGLNQLSNVDRNLSLRREALGSQIGLQELGRQDQALQQSLGAFGQAAAAKDLELSSRSAGLENLLALPTLQVAQQAAANAGKLPPERKPGLLGNIFEGLF